MAKTGPILIIENDADDREIMQDILRELRVKNKLYFFKSCQEVIDFLAATADDPFLVISDINLPGMSGIQLRQYINDHPELRKKSIPFVFLTTGTARETVDQAYEMMVQGYFEKPDNIRELREILKLILDYWNVCLHPNSYFLG